MTRTAARVAIALSLLATLAGCGDDGRTELRVLAASSLTDAFDALEQTYEDAHPDVDVVLSYGSSSSLAGQLIAGAPADVIATADTVTMADVEAADLLAGAAQPFATNTPALVTPAGNPADVRGLGDLADPDVLVALCVPAAPCGGAAQRLLDQAGVQVSPVTEEDNVRGVLTKVVAGEVDAGLVYRTDALAAGADVEDVDVPGSAEVVTTDPIAVLADAEQPDLAEAWVDLVRSEQGASVLADLGFGPVG